MSRATWRALRLGAVSLLVVTAVAIPVPASASTSCGASDGHTICVTVPAGPLTGDTTVTVTSSPNTGIVTATWTPSGGSSTQLIQMFEPSPSTNDYSFVWPTRKYLDAAGSLDVRSGSGALIGVPATLANGNVTDFQHSPNDWTNFLPGPWAAPQDPVVVAVGDGPSNQPKSNAVASRIAAIDPSLFLFLGDVYETGTFTENRNHAGISAMDSPGGGTLWGATADRTQPTLGNHENANQTAWIDYWHGRPLFTSFTFGGVLFLDLNSNASMSATSQQYQLVRNAITAPGAPACIVAYWHAPAITGSTIKSSQTALWSLLANNGGDLLLAGHKHAMAEYKPLDSSFNAGTSGAHMVELIAGSGGHSSSSAVTDTGGRVAWSKGKTAGLVAMTLNGAASGGAATSIGWTFQDVNGAALRTSSVACGVATNQAPVVSAGPDQAVTLPGQATLQGSATDDGRPNPPGVLTTAWSKVSGPGTVTFTNPASSTTAVSFSVPGTYVLRLSADDSELQSSDEVTMTVNPAGTVTLDIPVSAGSDDAEESATGAVSRTSSDLELVVESTTQTVGLRFAGVALPANAVIQRAYIQFEVDEVGLAPASLTIQGQAADSPLTFAAVTGDVSSRQRTFASVGPWAPVAWSTVQLRGPDQRTPDLTPILQEILGRSGWAAGNAMAFIITGTGTRTAESFDGTAAPVLHIEYTTP